VRDIMSDKRKREKEEDVEEGSGSEEEKDEEEGGEDGDDDDDDEEGGDDDGEPTKKKHRADKDEEGGDEGGEGDEEELPEEVIELFDRVEDADGWTLAEAELADVKKVNDNEYTFSFVRTESGEGEDDETEVKHDAVAHCFRGKWYIAPHKLHEVDLESAAKAVLPVVKAEILADCEEDEERKDDPSKDAVERLSILGFSVAHAYWPFHSDEEGRSKEAGVVVVSYTNDASDHGVWAAFKPGAAVEQISAYTFN